MKRSSEAGPRCMCGAIAEIVGPGIARCNASRRVMGNELRYCGREVPFTTEQRTFYVTDDETMSVETQPLGEGGAA